YAHEVLLAEAGVLRMGLVDPGSVNLGGADEHGLPLPTEYVYVNSYRDIHYQVELCTRFRLGPSISIFEPGFLRVALAFQRAGRPRGPCGAAPPDQRGAGARGGRAGPSDGAAGRDL